MTSGVVNACVTGLPSHMLSDVAEVLYEMLKTDREVCCDVIDALISVFFIIRFRDFLMKNNHTFYM